MNNADYDTVDLAETAEIENWLRRKGICTHSNVRKNECLFCGKTFDSFEVACAERREILDEFI